MRDCALAGRGDHDVGSRLAAIESAVLTFASVGSGAGQSPMGRPFKREICWNWNENNAHLRSADTIMPAGSALGQDQQSRAASECWGQWVAASLLEDHHVIYLGHIR